MGSAIFISVAESVLTNRLLASLRTIIPELDASKIINVGVTTLTEAIAPRYLDGVRDAYNVALTQTFYVATALTCLSFFSAVSTEWKLVKVKNGNRAGN